MKHQFIAARQQTIDSGTLTSFQENETAEITEIFGNVAHRFSTYTKRGMVDGVAVEAARQRMKILAAEVERLCEASAVKIGNR